MDSYNTLHAQLNHEIRKFHSLVETIDKNSRLQRRILKDQQLELLKVVSLEEDDSQKWHL